MYLFSASINPAWIQGGMSILTMSVVQGTSDLLQCGPGMCLADTQIMPGFPQSRNSWITKDRPFSFVTTFLVPGKHPLISPWLLLKAESTQTVGQGLQEGKKLYSFPISTCGCCLVAEDKQVWSQRVSVSLCESPLLLCASETAESLANSRPQVCATAGKVPESQFSCSLKNSWK